MITFYPNQTRRHWAFVEDNNKKIWVTGFAFVNDSFHQAEELARLFSAVGRFDVQQYVDTVSQLNGQFAVVVAGPEGCFATVDPIRSIPLFFTQVGDKLYLSDQGRSLLRHLDADKIDPTVRQEFLLTAYVTGGDTLFSSLKQLQAGECLCAKFPTPRQVALSKRRYFKYYSDQILTHSLEELKLLFDAILRRAFERLATSVQGRPLIVPLSGGLDSRLVATMLKRIGYEDVICYAYGHPGNQDVIKSKAIAKKLGLRWQHVPYSRQQWYHWYRTKEWQAYCQFADGLASQPHIDEWPAIWELKQRGSIPADAIFVPGHTGDFISGGHLKYLFDSPGEIGEEQLIASIINKHYGLWPDKLKEQSIREAMAHRIRASLSPLPKHTEQQLASAYEYWEWQERQAKFILNAVRGYEFWGYEWRVPLWDQEMMTFWRRVPFHLKPDKVLYNSYLVSQDSYEVFQDLLKQPQKRPERRIKRWVKWSAWGRSRLSYISTLRKSYRKKYLEYFEPANTTLGIHNYLTVSFLNGGRRNINSILVKDYLRTLE